MKFRAFKDGSWWYSDDEAYNLKEYDGVLYLCEDVKFYSNTEEYKLEIIGVAYQHTGLKDKNNVDIYKGDIMESPKGYSVGLVEFTEGVFILSQGQDVLGRDKFDILNTVLDYEVIGNICENAELLRED